MVLRVPAGSLSDMANLAPDLWAAQRNLVGTLNVQNGIWFEPNGEFCSWREQRASNERGEGVAELSEGYDVLGNPYVVRAEQLYVRGKRIAGFTIVVSWDVLPVLIGWAPSFQKPVEGCASRGREVEDAVLGDRVVRRLSA